MVGGKSEARVLPPVESQDGWAAAGGEAGGLWYLSAVSEVFAAGIPRNGSTVWEETWFRGLAHGPPAGRKTFYWNGREIAASGSRFHADSKWSHFLFFLETVCSPLTPHIVYQETDAVRLTGQPNACFPRYLTPQEAETHRSHSFHMVHEDRRTAPISPDAIPLLSHWPRSLREACAPVLYLIKVLQVCPEEGSKNRASKPMRTGLESPFPEEGELVGG